MGLLRLFPFETIGKDRVFFVGSDADDGAQGAGAIEKAMPRVVGIAIRVAERDESFLAAIGINTKDLIELLIADVEEASGVPYGSFGKSKSSSDQFKLGLIGDKFQNFGDSALSSNWRFEAAGCWAGSESGNRSSERTKTHNLFILVVFPLRSMRRR